MGRRHVRPAWQEEAFNCPHCCVFAQQAWKDLDLYPPGSPLTPHKVAVARCMHCRDASYWVDGKMVFPPSTAGDPPSIDMPQDCRQVFEEAQRVFSASPRAAAALLRLCIEMLMGHLGQSGKPLNDAIAALVEQGLPPRIQQALDICRVIGNNAVHPGEILPSEDVETAAHLFGLVNMIIGDRITRPREIDDMFKKLPEGNKKSIERRDGGTANPT